MSAAAQAVSVEVGQLRELLATDRSSAGEARTSRDPSAPLRTSDFQRPLRVTLRRQWRLDRQLRVRTAYAGAAVLLTGVLLVWWSWGTDPVLAAAATHTAAPKRDARASAVQAEVHPGHVPVGVGTRAAAIAAEDDDDAVAVQELGASASTLSARLRLQRADLWLRVQTPRAASEARSLLESALEELPGSVHGQVALAEACLRLGDETCARTAIHKAVLARPWRAKYRALARDIDQQFGSERADVAAKSR